MVTKKANLTKAGITTLPKDKPVVYKIENSAGDLLYAGVAKRGRVGARLTEHLPEGPDPVRGGVKVSITQKPSIAEALETEARIIKHAQPPQNIKGK